VKVKWQDLLRPQQVQPDDQTQVVVQTETIPIVFVPGIMGSRLKRKKSGEDKWVWDPDRGPIKPGLGMLWRYGLFTTAAGKQKDILAEQLDGSYLLMDEDDANGAKAQTKEGRKSV